MWGLKRSPSPTLPAAHRPRLSQSTARVVVGEEGGEGDTRGRRGQTGGGGREEGAQGQGGVVVWRVVPQTQRPGRGEGGLHAALWGRPPTGYVTPPEQ